MPRPLGVKISGSGSAVPERVLSNQYFIDRLDTTDEWIRERTGILERRICSEKESTATLATAAARDALADAGMTPDDIDLIIVSTITPECPFPSTACFVQEALTKRTIPAFDLAAACSGFIYGFITATSLLQTGTFRNILVIGAETMSRITDYEDRATCILFGDGAGAVVLSAVPDTSGPALLHHKMHAEGNGFTMLCVPGGGSRTPASQMSINERLHYIKMQGREVYKLAVKRNLELVESTLEEAGVKPDELAIVIPHQSNLRIIESARQRLGLPPERMFCNIQKYGNTSAASVPLGLNECRKTGRVKSGDLVLMVAFGAGLTWGSVLVRI
ncbi:3-oxoacyl-[acyl-carrier-protein] synthase 3 [Phycisphaerae bacterium RAS2]|nr:3-oxoacyl-[acyl-carrier-protein] synthase 3 [Phycisphaerae bacterium RAS2]